MRFDGSRWPTPSPPSLEDVRRARDAAAARAIPYDMGEALIRLRRVQYSLPVDDPNSDELRLLIGYLDSLYQRTGARDRMQLAQGTIPDA